MQFWVIVHTVHSVPNRRVGQNKRAGGKFLKKHFNKAMQGGFFLTINKSAGQIPIKMQENKRAGGFFLKNNKRADQNKAVQGGMFPLN